MIDPTAFIARGAIVLGDVHLGAESSVWYNAVLRGDTDRIAIGDQSNIQDLTMIHADPGAPNVIGSEVTIGHRCVLHGVRIADRSLIGMGAVLLGGSENGEEALVAAGAVVREGFRVPSGTLVAGVPAKVIRELTPEERKSFQGSAEGYVRKLRLYLA